MFSRSTSLATIVASVAILQTGCPAFTSDDFRVDDSEVAGESGGSGGAGGISIGGAGGDSETGGAGEGGGGSPAMMGPAGAAGVGGMPTMMMPPPCTSSCNDGAPCTDASICANGVCSGGMCASPSCDDKMENGSETDVDCGGTCPPCATGKVCKAMSDCSTMLCVGGRCVGMTPIPNCHDGIKNGAESDVDCGTALGCAKCADGKMCGKNPDCMSNKCEMGVCQTK